MTDKVGSLLDPAHKGMEVVGEVRAKSDAYGGTFVLWKQLPVHGMQLVTLASAQAAVAAAEVHAADLREIADVWAKTVLERNTRITALEAALQGAHAALKEATYYMTDNSYNGCKASDAVRETLDSIDALGLPRTDLKESL